MSFALSLSRSLQIELTEIEKPRRAWVLPAANTKVNMNCLFFHFFSFRWSFGSFRFSVPIFPSAVCSPAKCWIRLIPKWYLNTVNRRINIPQHLFHTLFCSSMLYSSVWPNRRSLIVSYHIESMLAHICVHKWKFICLSICVSVPSLGESSNRLHKICAFQYTHLQFKCALNHILKHDWKEKRRQIILHFYKLIAL